MRDATCNISLDACARDLESMQRVGRIYRSGTWMHPPMPGLRPRTLWRRGNRCEFHPFQVHCWVRYGVLTYLIPVLLQHSPCATPRG
ncbi:hypothetical protein EV363DRAFT_1405635 [Boletus edulis]|nr:hypothetical protein EV363DRAFT_1405635 [Boletus edulis]